MIEIIPSRSGDDTATIDGRYIHSAYNPRKEALKLASEKIDPGSDKIIIIGPGLNYLGNAIMSIKPSTGLILLHMDGMLEKNAIRTGHPSWSPSSVLNLKTFLNKNLCETDLEGLTVFENHSVTGFFKTVRDSVLEILAQHLRELHGNITTMSGMGRRMIRNACRNFFSTDISMSPSMIQKPILIASSGPSLMDSIHAIRSCRSSFMLLALPSSLRFLMSERIEPDMVITTDPGYYAGRHLDFLPENIPTAAPLTACFGNKTFPLCLLESGSTVEKTLIDSSTFPYCPPNGTVAGSALSLSLGLTTGPVIFCGQDFGTRDILAHARPHSFDEYNEKDSVKTKPLYSTLFERTIASSTVSSDGLRRGTAMNAYYGWFAQNTLNWPGRLFMLNPVCNLPGSMQGLDSESFEKLLSSSSAEKYVSEPSFSEIPLPDHEEKIRRLDLFINRGLSDLQKLKSLPDSYPAKSWPSRESILYYISMPSILELRRISRTSSMSRKNADLVAEKTDLLITDAEAFIKGLYNYAY